MSYRSLRANAIARERRPEAAPASPPPSPPSPPSTQKHDLLGRAVVIAGVLISASGLFITGANYLSTERTNSARLLSDEFAAFRAARDAEDLFWKNASNDFLALFDSAAQANAAMREARLFATADLVQGHVIPDFTEFPNVKLRARCAVIIRAEDNRTNLLNGLQEQAQGNAELVERYVARTGRAELPFDPACAAQREQARASLAGTTGAESERRDEAIAAPDAAGAGEAAPAVASVATASLSEAAPLGNESLPGSAAPEALTGPSKDGWDVDVFWCKGPDALLNYRRAVVVSKALADLSTSGRALASGVRLGRVRRRPASEQYQQQEGSPARYAMVVADSGPGEREAAIALRDSANTLLGAPMLRLGTSTGTPTRWYLSMFVCAPATAPAGPAEASATAPDSAVAAAAH